MTEELQAQVADQVDAPVIETPEVEKPDPNDLRAVIEHAQKEVESRPRDETGKFTQKPQAAQSAAIDPKSPLGAPAVAEVKTLEAPATWKAEEKAFWATLSDQAKSTILRREKEFAQGIQSKADEAKQARAVAEALEPVIGPHRQNLMQAGSVEQGIKNLLDTSTYAAKDPVGFIQWFAQSKGIDLGNMQQPTGDQNPEVAQLKQSLYGLQSEIAELKGYTTQQQTRTVVSEIQAFADEKDQSGQALRPHFESVRKEVYELIPLIKSTNPDWSVRQVMDAAYSKAVRLNDDVFGKVQSEQAEKARLAKEAAERAQKASLARKSLTGGSPVGDSQQKPAKNQSVRDAIKLAMQEHGVDARL